MPNILGSIETGKNSLITNQIGMDTTGHNIANVHTEGYSRQRALQGTMYPDDVQPGQIGKGVRIERVLRVYNQFIENTLRSERTGLAEWTTIYDSATLVEIALHEPGEHGLNYKTSDFFNAWQDLSEYPEDYGLRSLVRSAGADFGDTYNQILTDFNNLRTETDLKIENTVTRINEILGDIADLNTQILSVEVMGNDPNDLKDRRDNLTNELAEKLEITVTQTNNSLSISSGNYLLVEGSVTNQFGTQANPANNDLLDVTFGGAVLNFANTPNNSKGELGALVKFRDEIIPSYNTTLTEYAVSLAHNVNDEHYDGYSFNSATTGINFFSVNDTATPTASADMEVHTARSGILRVENMANIETGSHHLVLTATGGMTANTNGNLTGPGTIALNQAGAYTGTGGDYYVQIITANAAPGNLAGMQVQLMNGTTAVGAILNVPGGAIANNVTLGTVDGITFDANFNAAAGTFIPLERSNGYNPDIIGSLDGGPAFAVTPNLNLPGVTGGANNGFTAGGTMTLVFGATITTGNDTITAYTEDSNLGISLPVQNDVNNIAAASIAVAAGDNSNALDIVDLQFATLMNFSTQTFGQFYNKFTTTIASDTYTAFKWKNNQEVIVDQLKEQREAISGVNLDEELTSMLKYQRGFESASRYVTTIDGMIDVIINRMGYVGR